MTTYKSSKTCKLTASKSLLLVPTVVRDDGKCVYLAPQYVQVKDARAVHDFLVQFFESSQTVRTQHGDEAAVQYVLGALGELSQHPSRSEPGQDTVQNKNCTKAQ